MRRAWTRACGPHGTRSDQATRCAARRFCGEQRWMTDAARWIARRGDVSRRKDASARHRPWTRAPDRPVGSLVVSEPDGRTRRSLPTSETLRVPARCLCAGAFFGRRGKQELRDGAEAAKVGSRLKARRRGQGSPWHGGWMPWVVQWMEVREWRRHGGGCCCAVRLGPSQGVGSCNQRCEQPRREGRFRLHHRRGWPRRMRETCALEPRFPSAPRNRDQVHGAPA